MPIEVELIHPIFTVDAYITMKMENKIEKMTIMNFTLFLEIFNQINHANNKYSTNM